MAPKPKKDDQSKQPVHKTENIIMKYRLWAKAKGALAPYPAEDGSPLYTADLEAEEFLRVVVVLVLVLVLLVVVVAVAVAVVAAAVVVVAVAVAAAAVVVVAVAVAVAAAVVAAAVVVVEVILV